MQGPSDTELAISYQTKKKERAMSFWNTFDTKSPLKFLKTDYKTKKNWFKLLRLAWQKHVWKLQTVIQLMVEWFEINILNPE